MRYENEDGCNKSDVGGSSESFLKAPRVTRQVYAETSIIPVTYFIASWANSGSPVLRLATSLFSFRPALPSRSLSPSFPPQPRLSDSLPHDLALPRISDFSLFDRFQFRFIRAPSRPRDFFPLRNLRLRARGQSTRAAMFAL